MVCPSYLDSPRMKRVLKRRRADDILNGCVTQLVPCGIGCFVPLVLLFMPVGNHWDWWGVVAGVAFAQLHISCASSASCWCEKYHQLSLAHLV